MLPLYDTVQVRRFPAAVWALIVVNAAIFVYQTLLPPQELERFLYLCGMIPARLTLGGIDRFWPTLVTSMFLHGGWLHLIGNLWFLLVFGDNVEDYLGSARFLVYYFLGGLAAAALHVAVEPFSPVPTVGASGAISMVLGAYLMLFPAARVVTLVLLVFIPLFFQVPAFVWIGFWFFQQYLNGLAELHFAPLGEGVAWWAHIGGFVFGVAVGSACQLVYGRDGSADAHQRERPATRRRVQWP